MEAVTKRHDFDDKIPLSVTLPALALAASDGRFVGLTLEGLLSFEVVTLCNRLGGLPAVVRLIVLLRFPLSIFEKGFPGADFRLSVLGTLGPVSLGAGDWLAVSVSPFPLLLR